MKKQEATAEGEEEKKTSGKPFSSGSRADGQAKLTAVGKLQAETVGGGKKRGSHIGLTG